MSGQTEKQASQEPFDDKNLGELFQIALVNAPSPSRSAFNWGAFKPEAVKSPADLPPSNRYIPPGKQPKKAVRASSE